jgi:filamentous hemagglutinin
VGTLALDVVLAAVPFVPTKGGVTLAAKFGKGGLTILENAIRGRAFERAALSALGAAKNTSKVVVEGLGKSIPDIIRGSITEIKSGERISNTRQLRIQAAEAARRGVPLNLIVGPETKSVSGPLQDAIKESGGRVLVYNPTTGAFSLFEPK